MTRKPANGVRHIYFNTHQVKYEGYPFYRAECGEHIAPNQPRDKRRRLKPCPNCLFMLDADYEITAPDLIDL